MKSIGSTALSFLPVIPAQAGIHERFAWRSLWIASLALACDEPVIASEAKQSRGVSSISRRMDSRLRGNDEKTVRAELVEAGYKASASSARTGIA